MATDTLRWRFEDVSLHLPGDSQQPVLQSSHEASVSSLFRQAMAAMRVLKTAMLVLLSCNVRCFRALEHIDSVTSDRFLKLQDAALQQCHETDESDLNRLRKHFKTLKNTFTVYDLKEGFIDGLLQGLPDGSEEDQLYQFEEEMEKNSMLLRQYKSSNEQVECAAALQAETMVQRSCEAAYACHQANILELEADVRSAADSLRALESQVASMEEMRRSEAKESQVNHRFVEHMQWCDAMVSVLEALSGVSVASVSGDRLETRLTTRIDPSQPPPPGAASKTFEHTLLMQMDSSTGAVQHAELQPEGVDIQDLATAAIASQQGPSFVVRETQARLRHHLSRKQMLEEASAQFQLVPNELQDGVYQVQLPNGITADIKIPDEWPSTDADAIWGGCLQDQLPISNGHELLHYLPCNAYSPTQKGPSLHNSKTEAEAAASWPKQPAAYLAGTV
ncbi:MAG: hypothetical protein FRX49_07057 [Trebouxia sp. A1-2]|nr:MAG: hypothetical protein FRX49_07057 [Trebouxia sp. A1-2]